MTLIGTFVDLVGLGGGGVWLGDSTEVVNAAKMNDIREALQHAASGNFVRSVPVGGSLTRGLRAAAVLDVIDAIDFEIDNTSSYVSGSTGVTVPITVWLRVEDVSISVTPQIYNVTTAAVATTSGAAACAATAADFSGTNQKQTLLLTLLAGVNSYRLRVTPTASTFQFWAQGWRTLKI